jgi:hypothetical protein
MKSSSPVCPKCKGADFQLRVLRDEGAAAARCTGCSSDYLLLDSKDYWFDLIQQGYPRLVRCSCKSESFRLSIDYRFRDDGDVKHVEVHSICSACAKVRSRFDFEVDYSGTGHLLRKPLVPCKNPKVLYDLKELSLLLTLPDMLGIVDHLGEQGCRFLFRLRRDDEWVTSVQTAAEAKVTIDQDKYLFVYAAPGDLDYPEATLDSGKKEAALWKRSEVIRISSKSYICARLSEGQAAGIYYCSEPPMHGSYTAAGLSFYLKFSNEFIRGERIVRKSAAFQKVTASLIALLRNEFVCWRSSHCFDNPQVNLQVFGDRFTRKRK